METICRDCGDWSNLKHLYRHTRCVTFLCRWCVGRHVSGKRWVRNVLRFVPMEYVAEDWSLDEFQPDGWPISS